MARAIDLEALTHDDLMWLIDEILNRLPASELVTLRMAIDTKCREKLTDAKRAVVEETKAKVEALGLTLDDVFPRVRRGGVGTRRRRDAGQSLPVKYRSPEGETWSGRGHVPKWLQLLEEQGRSREEFLVVPDER